VPARVKGFVNDDIGPDCEPVHTEPLLVLVDHAFIVAGGEISKQARNWLGNKLDATKRSQVMFMDREDILNLFVVTNLPLPSGTLPKASDDGDLPF
jgi:hypothetical protein